MLSNIPAGADTRHAPFNLPHSDTLEKQEDDATDKARKLWKLTEQLQAVRSDLEELVYDSEELLSEMRDEYEENLWDSGKEYRDLKNAVTGANEAL